MPEFGLLTSLIKDKAYSEWTQNWRHNVDISHGSAKRFVLCLCLILFYAQFFECMTGLVVSSFQFPTQSSIS